MAKRKSTVKVPMEIMPLSAEPFKQFWKADNIFARNRAMVIKSINETLEQLWDVTNGRYVPDVKNSVPTNSPPEGSMVVYSSGGVYRIYIYLNSGWRVWTSD